MKIYVKPVVCRMCGEIYPVEVDLEGYQQWKAGELVQNALPELSKADRELLISATCDHCWKGLFSEDFDE